VKNQTHELKVWMDFWQDLTSGRKTFEVRKDDRGFNVGDTLILKEWQPMLERYTGKELVVTVTYLLPGGVFGIEPGYVVMSISINQKTKEGKDQ